MSPTPAVTTLLVIGWMVSASGLVHRPADAQEPSVVERITPFAQSTGHARWSPKGDWIAFDRPGENGYTQLYVARADLAEGIAEERCLTCHMHDLRKLHVGNPTWHPSGDYLAVQVSRPVRPGGEPLRFREVPGGNLGSDLYLVHFDGREYWNLTNLGERGGRVQSPHFSHEGSKLVWAERTASGGGVFGKWVIRMAEIEFRRQVPRLKGTRTFKPGARQLFYDTHGFTTDDLGVVLTGNLEPKHHESGMDVYRLELESGAIKRLTQTDAELDRFALQAPNGNWIVWSSSRDIGSGEVNLERRQVTAVRKADLWMMNAEGLSVQRLTHFNDVHSPNYLGPTSVLATSWNRDGDKLLALALPVGSNRPGDLYLIELNEPIGR